VLEVQELVKFYGGASGRRARQNADSGARVLAVDGVSFDVRPGELFTLLGPSGCGKTTTLRSIAGLETPDGGLISVADRAVFDSTQRVNVAVNRRALGMVFQSYAIWPHMTVFQNVAFPLQVGPRSKRMNKAKVGDRVAQTLEVTGLSAYASRPATNLSGGQQQRLALARAMVTRPALMLLDEPLSNLDAKLRESMRIELQRLQRELGLTSVYVTHDQTEALVLSSRIAVMSEGKVMQVGTPDEIYRNPANQFVAEFVGVANFIKAVVVERSGPETRLDTDEGPIWVASEVDHPAGTRLLVSIRPESMTLNAGEARAGRNAMSGVVSSRSFHGDSTQYVVNVGEHQFKVRCDARLGVGVDDKVELSFEPEGATVVPL
jgi:iron(III) transport system ATP-binding protein